MTQVYEKTTFEMEVKESEQKTAQKAIERKIDNLLGDLNPRYFEQARTPNKAKQELWAKYGYLNTF